MGAGVEARYSKKGRLMSEKSVTEQQLDAEDAVAQSSDAERAAAKRREAAGLTRAVVPEEPKARRQTTRG